MPNKPYTTIDLVRHGVVETPSLFCAQANEPLSKTGWAQMKLLEDLDIWEQIVSSPYARCQQFAQYLAKTKSLPHCTDEGLQEMDFGLWQGKTLQSIQQQEEDRLAQLWFSPLDFTAPDGESMLAFIERTQAAWHRLLAQHLNKSILLLSHAGVIRVILSIALNIDYVSTQKFNVAHGKINRLRYYPDQQYSLQAWGVDPASLAEQT